MSVSQYVKNHTYIQQIKDSATSRRDVEKLKNKLIEENYGFVFNSVRKLKRGRLVDEDDIQNGLLGIAETINKFDSDKAKSIGALGFFRIRHNVDKYRFHNVGIRIPKDKISDVKYYGYELQEDRVEDEDTPSNESLLAWVCEEAQLVLSKEEYNVFTYKTFSRLTYNEIAEKLQIERIDAMRLYRSAYNKVVTHCKKQVV